MLRAGILLTLLFGVLDATVLKGPYLIYDGVNTEMKVLWQLDSTQSCIIDWGQGSALITESGAGDYEHQHIYTIEGLTPATRYAYQVSCDSDNVGNGSFYTAPYNDGQNVKLLVYGDTRTSPSDHDHVNAQMINTYESDGAFQTLTLHAGDWVANADSESDWADQYFDPSYQHMHEFQANMPVNGIRGNHEKTGDLFLKYIPYPHKSGGFYWSYDYGPAHITVVDQYTDYSTGSIQYNWLKNDLESSVKKWKFIVLHEPGWSAGGHGNNLDVQNYIQPLAVANNVAMIFSGHNHYYARAVVDGVQHVTTGGGGAPLYTPDPNAENIVMVAKAYHFCEVEIMGDNLVFTARDTNGAVLDLLQLSQTADTIPPVITILGGNPLNLQLGDTFTDPGATATDNMDGTVAVVASGTVDTSTVGIYTRTYTATDAAGNRATAARTVNVVYDWYENNGGVAYTTKEGGSTVKLDPGLFEIVPSQASLDFIEKKSRPNTEGCQIHTFIEMTSNGDVAAGYKNSCGDDIDEYSPGTTVNVGKDMVLRIDAPLTEDIIFGR